MIPKDLCWFHFPPTLLEFDSSTTLYDRSEYRRIGLAIPPHPSVQVAHSQPGKARFEHTVIQVRPPSNRGPRGLPLSGRHAASPRRSEDHRFLTAWCAHEVVSPSEHDHPLATAHNLGTRFRRLPTIPKDLRRTMGVSTERCSLCGAFHEVWCPFSA